MLLSLPQKFRTRDLILERPKVSVELNGNSQQTNGLRAAYPFIFQGSAIDVGPSRRYTLTDMAATSWVEDWRMGLVPDFASDYFEGSTPSVTTYPMTFTAWVTWDNPTAELTSIGGVGSSAAWNVQFVLQKSISGYVQAVARDTSATGIATDTVAVTAGKWYHVVGVLTSSTYRAVYKNGVFIDDDTTAVTGETIDRQRIGCRPSSAATWYHNGRMAEFRIYDRALCADEILDQFLDPWHAYIEVGNKSYFFASAASAFVGAPDPCVVPIEYEL